MYQSSQHHSPAPRTRRNTITSLRNIRQNRSNVLRTPQFTSLGESSPRMSHSGAATPQQSPLRRRRHHKHSRSLGNEDKVASTWQQFLELHNYEPFIHGSTAENTSRLHQKRRNSIASTSASLFHDAPEEKRASKNPLKRIVKALKQHFLPSSQPKLNHSSPVFSASALHMTSSNRKSSHLSRNRRASVSDAHSGSKKRRSLLKKTHSSRRVLGFVDEVDVMDGKKAVSNSHSSSARRISFDSIEVLSERRLERQRSRERDELLEQLQKLKEQKTGKNKPTYLSQGNIIINRNSFDETQRTLKESADFMKRCERISHRPVSPVLDAIGADVLIHHILIFLDWFSLERVGYTCRAIFYYSSSNFLWRKLTAETMSNRPKMFRRLCEQYHRNHCLGFWKEQFFTFTPNSILYNQQRRLINHSFYIHARDGEFLTKDQAMKALTWLGLIVPEEEVNHILTPECTIDFQLFSSFTWRYQRDFPEDAVNIRCRRIFVRLCRPDCSVLFIQDVTSRAQNLRWNPHFLKAIVDLINETREDALSPSSRYITFEEFQTFFVDEKQERFHNSSYILI